MTKEILLRPVLLDLLIRILAGHGDVASVPEETLVHVIRVSILVWNIAVGVGGGINYFHGIDDSLILAT
jgi:hypothetical protein